MLRNFQLAPKACTILEKGLGYNVKDFENFLNENIKQLIEYEEKRQIRGKTVSFGKAAKLLCKDVALILKPDRFRVYDYVVVNIIDRLKVNATERKYESFANEFDEEIRVHPPGTAKANYCYRCGAELTVQT